MKRLLQSAAESGGTLNGERALSQVGLCTVHQRSGRSGGDQCKQTKVAIRRFADSIFRLTSQFAEDRQTIGGQTNERLIGRTVGVHVGIVTEFASQRGPLAGQSQHGPKVANVTRRIEAHVANNLIRLLRT